MNQILTESMLNLNWQRLIVRFNASDVLEAFPRKKNRAPSKPRKESLAPSKPRKESLAQSKPRKESPAPSKPRKKVQVPSKPWGEGWMPSKDVASFPAEIDKDLGSKVMEAKTARAKAEDEAAKGPTYNLSAGNEDSKNPSECRINKTQTVTLE